MACFRGAQKVILLHATCNNKQRNSPESGSTAQKPDMSGYSQMRLVPHSSSPQRPGSQHASRTPCRADWKRRYDPSPLNPISLRAVTMVTLSCRGAGGGGGQSRREAGRSSTTTTTTTSPPASLCMAGREPLSACGIRDHADLWGLPQPYLQWIIVGNMSWFSAWRRLYHCDRQQ